MLPRRLRDRTRPRRLRDFRGKKPGQKPGQHSLCAVSMSISTGCSSVSLLDERLRMSHAVYTHAVLQGHASRVESVAYFPRGDLIVSGAKDGIVLLWDAKTGELIAELKCHSDRVTSIQVLPDEEHVITCSDDGTIRSLNIVDVIRVL